jgi:signal transduction histidine kinase/CheY-like chemotaxis protein
VPLWLGHVPWTPRLWFALLFVSMIPYGFLLPKIMKPPPVGDERHINLKHAAWIFWLTVVAFIFLSGNWALRWQPPGSQNEFHLAQQTFVYLTIVGQVFTLLFLSSSRKAIFAVVGIGILLPFYYQIAPELRLNPVGVAPGWVNLHIFFGGQIAVYLLIGWFLPSASGQRREILLEEEHRRAEAERARANHFIVTVGHDLKQPLTAINLRLATLAKRTAQDPEISLLAREIQQQTSALGEMIQASFDLSRLHSGTWDVSPREVALPNLIERVTGEFHATAGEKGVLLEVEHVPEYVVWTDPDALGRILRNLLTNAIKYTPAQGAAGPGRVAVEFEATAEQMHISISDNGIGIPASRTDDIFKEYVQLDNPERDRNKGFGLGLSIVRGLAQLLNHEFTFASTEGSGSRFTIAVPIKSRIPLELLSAQLEALSAPRFTDMVVFLVDDDEAPRNALVEHLLDWGCYVVDGDSAAELIEKLRTEDIPPHKSEFILSDYRLRDGKTGLEAISAVRAARGNQTVPAAIWTAESGTGVLREVARAETQLLTKPVDLQKLASALKKADSKYEMDAKGRGFVPAK